MREILFRGKRCDNGEWVEGYYARKGVDKDTFKHFICVMTFNVNGNTYSSMFYLTDIEVIPETVGQYTGLTDKNGIKIFDGDIIQDSNYPEYVFRIEYHNGTIIASEIHTFDKVYLDNFICFNIFEAFVIGNIHDNPELLEGKA